MAAVWTSPFRSLRLWPRPLGRPTDLSRRSRLQTFERLAMCIGFITALPRPVSCASIGFVALVLLSPRRGPVPLLQASLSPSSLLPLPPTPVTTIEADAMVVAAVTSTCGVARRSPWSWRPHTTAVSGVAVDVSSSTAWYGGG